MRTVFVIQKATIFVVESWVSLCMTLISVAFVAIDIETQGLRFSGSLIPLASAFMFAGLSVRAERKIRRL
jgi:hypothetical protein